MVKAKLCSGYRLHPMARLFLAGCVVVAVIVAAMSQSVAIANYQYELEALRKQLDEEQRIGQHLQLRVAQLQSLERIEKIARNDLGMVEPTSVRTIVLNPGAAEPTSVSGTLRAEHQVETPSRYLVAVSRLLAKLLPALDQAEAGKLGDR